MDFILRDLSCFCIQPVSIVEEARIDSLPDIPKRTLGIEDPPEKNKVLSTTISSFFSNIFQVNLQGDSVINSSQKVNNLSHPPMHCWLGLDRLGSAISLLCKIALFNYKHHASIKFMLVRPVCLLKYHKSISKEV